MSALKKLCQKIASLVASRYEDDEIENDEKFMGLLEKTLAPIILEVRRAALLEAAKAVCYNCRSGVFRLEYLDNLYFHVSGQERIKICDADNIHALLAKKQARGEGGGNA